MSIAAAPTHEVPSAPALTRRVAYALLLPVSELARHSGLSLEDIGELAEMAAFHGCRRAGLKMREIAEQLGVSMRKAALLSQKLKRNFVDDEREVGLARRIEFVLWAEPLSAAQIARALPEEDPDDVAGALEVLVAEDRVRRIARPRREIYERVHGNSRLVSAKLEARLDALQNLTQNVARTVLARFVGDDDRAFARTVSFRIRERDLPRLREAYEDLWKLVTEIEQTAKCDDDSLTMELSMLWSVCDPSLDQEESP